MVAAATEVSAGDSSGMSLVEDRASAGPGSSNASAHGDRESAGKMSLSGGAPSEDKADKAAEDKPDEHMSLSGGLSSRSAHSLADDAAEEGEPVGTGRTNGVSQTFFCSFATRTGRARRFSARPIRLPTDASLCIGASSSCHERLIRAP